MYRTCYAVECATGCCDYYAYCTYPSPGIYCYPSVTYYYYDFWWIYVVCSIVFLCVLLSAFAGVRRRNRLRRQRDQIIIAGASNPSYVQGQPVYPNDRELVTGQPVMGDQLYIGQPNNMMNNNMNNNMNNTAYGLAQPLNNNNNQPYI